LRIQTTKNDFIWSYLGYFFNLGVNVILLPFILHFLAPEELGIWYAFGNIYALVVLIDFGFAPTFLRNLTYAWSGSVELREEGFLSVEDAEKPNYHLFTLILKITKRVYLYMSSIMLLLMLTVGAVYIRIITKDIGNNTIIIAYIIYSAGACANLLFNYHILVLKSIGAYKGSQQAIVLSKVVQLFVSGIGIALGGGLVILSCSYIMAGIVLRLGSRHFFKKEKDVAEYLVHRKRINITKYEMKKTFKTLWVNTKKAGVLTLAQTIMVQSGLFFCSAFVGIHKGAGYGLCSQLVYIIIAIGEIYFSTNLASLTSARIKSDFQRQQTIFSTSLVILWGVTFSGIAVLSLFGPVLLRIAGSSIGLAVPMLIVMGFYLLLQANCSLYVTFISLNNAYPFLRVYIITTGFQLTLFLFFALFYHLTIVIILGVDVLTRIVLCISLRLPFACYRELDLTPANLIRMGCNQIFVYAKRVLYAQGRSV
jgi:O-antigen/teichoic acid export membrane protein